MSKRALGFRIAFLLATTAVWPVFLAGCGALVGSGGFRHHALLQENRFMSKEIDPNLPQSDEHWQQFLTPEQHYVLRRQGTERAFTGEYWNEKSSGTYACAGCGQPLFHSDAKYDSGSGWPSFYEPTHEDNVAHKSDNTFFARRTEVLCSRCDGHLGHVFPDGPEPTGMRYCINSAALKLEKSKPPQPPSDS